MNDLYCQALDLPAEQRGELALILLDSLADEDDLPIRLDPELQAEIRRRISASDRGEVQMLSLEQVMSMLRERRETRATP
jgi:putative addiction module component (TIGR02574 family)